MAGLLRSRELNPGWMTSILHQRSNTNSYLHNLQKVKKNLNKSCLAFIQVKISLPYRGTAKAVKERRKNLNSSDVFIITHISKLILSIVFYRIYDNLKKCWDLPLV